MSDKSASQHLFADALARVQAICATLAAEGQWPAIDFSRVVVEPPRDASHGDMATNAMVLAKDAKVKAARSRRQDRGKAARRRSGRRCRGRRARLHQSHLEAFGLDGRAAHDARDVRPTASAIATAPRSIVEYVSPIRPADACRPLPRRVAGDALCGLLDFAGYDVTREYYINDAGAQVDVLALGVPALPRGARREHRRDSGRAVSRRLSRAGRAGARGRAWRQAEGDAGGSWLPIVRNKAIAMMMDMIKGDLAALNIKHEVFFSERSLIETGNNKVTETIDFLRAKGDIYEGRLPPPKGKPVEDYETDPDAVPRHRLWRRRRSSADQVGRLYTYFASDIAYHKNKVDRGFLDMIDVFGADHGGYIKRRRRR